jgi:hypothetical protein
MDRRPQLIPTDPDTMKPPRRYLTPAELADQARARRNLAAAQLVAMAAAIAAAAALIIKYAHP